MITWRRRGPRCSPSAAAAGPVSRRLSAEPEAPSSEALAKQPSSRFCAAHPQANRALPEWCRDRHSVPFGQHLELIERDGRIGVVDRGSQLGALVDGMPLGGARGFSGPIFPASASSVIVLGGQRSAFAFELRLPGGS